MSYAILLLNTDLHVADISKRMTRQEFIDNTLSTIIGAPPGHEAPHSLLSSSRSTAKQSLYSVFGGGGGDTASSRSLDPLRDSHPFNYSTQSLKLPNQSASTLHSSTSPSPILLAPSSFSSVDPQPSTVDPTIASGAKEIGLTTLLKVSQHLASMWTPIDGIAPRIFIMLLKLSR